MKGALVMVGINPPKLGAINFVHKQYGYHLMVHRYQMLLHQWPIITYSTGHKYCNSSTGVLVDYTQIIWEEVAFIWKVTGKAVAIFMTGKHTNIKCTSHNS